MLDNLLRFKKKQKYVVWDFETESLSLFFARPWQLSFMTFEGKTLLEEHDFFIDIPNLYVSPEAAKVTGFSYEKYNRLKRNKEKCLEVFEKFLYDPEYINVGHNILRFDVYIHNTLRRICGKEPDFSFLNRLIDTNCLSKAWKCEITKPKTDTNIQWMYRLADFYRRGVRTTQKQMLKDCDIEFDEQKLHDSSYDVLKNAELFQQLIWRVEI